MKEIKFTEKKMGGDDKKNDNEGKTLEDGVFIQFNDHLSKS